MPCFAALCQARRSGVDCAAKAIPSGSYMSTSDQSPSPPVTDERADRLDSWKEVAAYLNRDVRTVQRWEKKEGLPVRRHLHEKLGTIYAYKSELDAWWRSTEPKIAAHEAAGDDADALDDTEEFEFEPAFPQPTPWPRWLKILLSVAVA